MKRILFYAALIALLLTTAGCSCKHEWIEANCDTAKTCTICNEISGEPLGHQFTDWKDVPLRKVRKCELCGFEESIWQEIDSTATVTVPSNGNNDVTQSTFSSHEEHIVEYLKTILTDFRDPSSVRVIDIISYDEDEDLYYLNINAANGFGGTNTTLYELTDGEISKSNLSENIITEMVGVYGKRISCDIGEINTALDEYCSSMGWN